MITHLLAASSGSGGSLITLLVFMLPLGLLFVFMRNQQKRVKQQQSNQQAAQVGEDILTTSGIFGTIVDEDDEEGIVTVEIAPGTQIRMVRAGIARRITQGSYMTTPTMCLDPQTRVDGSSSTVRPRLMQPISR